MSMSDHSDAMPQAMRAVRAVSSNTLDSRRQPVLTRPNSATNVDAARSVATKAHHARIVEQLLLVSVTLITPHI